VSAGLALLADILVNNLLPIFLVAGAGFVLGRTARPDLPTLSRLAFYVLSPCFVFNILLATTLSVDELGRMALFAVAVIALSGLLAWVIARALGLSQILTSAFLLVNLFANTGNYGISLNQLAFGDAAAARASIYFVCSTVLVYSLGVFIAGHGRANARQALLNALKVPALYAVLLAVPAKLSGWQAPQPLDAAIRLLAQAAIPVMLLILGVQLARTPRIERPRMVAAASGLRLLSGPLIGLALALLFRLDGPARQAGIVEASMPPAVINTILALEYDSEPSFVTSTVFVATLLSPLTLTVILALLKA
jgi:predicted permease